MNLFGHRPFVLLTLLLFAHPSWTEAEEALRIMEFKNNGEAPLDLYYILEDGGDEKFATVVPGRPLVQKGYPGNEWRFKKGGEILGEYRTGSEKKQWVDIQFLAKVWRNNQRPQSFADLVDAKAAEERLAKAKPLPPLPDAGFQKGTSPARETVNLEGVWIPNESWMNAENAQHMKITIRKGAGPGEYHLFTPGKKDSYDVFAPWPGKANVYYLKAMANRQTGKLLDKKGFNPQTGEVFIDGKMEWNAQDSPNRLIASGLDTLIASNNGMPNPMAYDRDGVATTDFRPHGDWETIDGTIRFTIAEEDGKLYLMLRVWGQAEYLMEPVDGSKTKFQAVKSFRRPENSYQRIELNTIEPGSNTFTLTDKNAGIFYNGQAYPVERIDRSNPRLLTIRDVGKGDPDWDQWVTKFQPPRPFVPRKLSELGATSKKDQLPTLELCRKGYNVLNMNPANLYENRPPEAIFRQLALDTRNYQGPFGVIVDDMFQVVEEVTASQATTSVLAASSQELSMGFNMHVDAEIGVEGFGGGGVGFGMEHNRSSRAGSEKVLRRTVEYTTKYWVFLMKRNAELTRGFMASVRELDPNNDAGFRAFFDAYGTHYPLATLFGSTEVIEGESTRADFERAVSSAYDASVSGELNVAGVAASMTTSGGMNRGEQSSESSERSEERMRGIGSQSDRDFFAPIKVIIKPIYELVRPQYFGFLKEDPRAAEIDRLREKMRQHWIEYIKEQPRPYDGGDIGPKVLTYAFYPRTVSSPKITVDNDIHGHLNVVVKNKRTGLYYHNYPKEIWRRGKRDLDSADMNVKKNTFWRGKGGVFVVYPELQQVGNQWELTWPEAQDLVVYLEGKVASGDQPMQEVKTVELPVADLFDPANRTVRRSAPLSVPPFQHEVEAELLFRRKAMDHFNEDQPLPEPPAWVRQAN